MRIKAIFIALVAFVALAGCGSSNSNSSSSSSSSSPPAGNSPSGSATGAASSAASPSSSGAGLSLAADPGGQLKFDKSTLSAKAGKVTISFANASPTSHNLTIQSAAGATVGATPTFGGGTKTLTVTLKPGTYTFFCSVPGHRQSGMQGTLTVANGASASATTPAPTTKTATPSAPGGY